MTYDLSELERLLQNAADYDAKSFQQIDLRDALVKAAPRHDRGPAEDGEDAFGAAEYKNGLPSAVCCHSDHRRSLGGCVMSAVRGVEIKQVIIITSNIGNGVEGDPIRPFVQVFDMDGSEIMTLGDYTQ